MGGGGHLSVGQRDLRDAIRLARKPIGQPRSLSDADRRPPAQIGKRERADAIAAVGGSEKGEQRRVLADGQYLAVGKRPAPGGEVAGKRHDLAKKLLGWRPAVAKRKYTLKRNEIVHRQRW